MTDRWTELKYIRRGEIGRRLATALALIGHATIIMVMAKREPFTLVYAAEVKGHLLSIESKYHSLIRSQVESHLRFEPNVETRNRKPLKQPIAFGADWELRLGPENRFRVFYQLDTESRQVQVLAIGRKEGNRLFFGGKEFEG
jgi:hypothetical protein